MQTQPIQTAEKELVDLHPERLVALIKGARDTAPVAGLSHNHYKYPARFSPKFVRAVIDAFTEVGDVVLDPFLGGGTTAVEALASGRNCVGVDISSLAVFVAEAKTAVLSDDELAELRSWASRAPTSVNMGAISVHFAAGAHEGYYRNIDGKKFWRLRKAVEQALASTLRLSPKSEVLARCIVLKTAQWALDGRAKLPSVSDFRHALGQTALSVISGSEEFRASVAKFETMPQALLLHRSAAGIEEVPDVRARGTPRLVLTSPPYPGIHVLYHRWQVDGRRETPAPFLIANKLDGAGESYYTLGHRHTPGLKTYWANLSNVLRATAALSDPQTVFVQVVAFSEPEWQLPRYLEVCGQAGLKEQFLRDLSGADGRLWREVPNRRWYADQRGAIPASREVVLFHRLAAMPPIQPDRSAQAVPLPTLPGCGPLAEGLGRLRV